MSYTIHLRINNQTCDHLTIVEKTCWYYANGGTWTERDANNHTLHMGGSGTSGLLRIKSSCGQIFTVILGIHNYGKWCDVQVNLSDSDTGMKLHPEYYGGGRLSGQAYGEISRTTSKGRHVRLCFDRVDGHELSAVLTYA